MKKEKSIQGDETIKATQIIGTKLSKEWICYLFGSKDFTYVPAEGYKPNIIVRFFMKLCLDCKWERQV